MATGDWVLVEDDGESDGDGGETDVEEGDTIIHGSGGSDFTDGGSAASDGSVSTEMEPVVERDTLVGFGILLAVVVAAYLLSQD